MKYICVVKDSKDVYVYLENQQKILRKVKEIRMRIKRVEMDEERGSTPCPIDILSPQHKGSKQSKVDPKLIA